MDKRMHLGEKMSMENNAANQESNEQMFVHRVARSGLVLKFKVNKYGTLPSKHTISSSQEAMMSGGKQNVRELLDNFEANNCSPNAIPLLEQSEISAAEATRSNKIISLFDNAKVAPQEEIGYTCDECGKWFKEISSLHGHKGVHRREKKRHAVCALHSLLLDSKRHRSDEFSASMTCSNKHTSADEEIHEMREVADILLTLAQRNTGQHVCDKCNAKFSSGPILGGHKRKHWWEEYRKMALPEDRDVKPRLPILPHHKAESSGLVVVPTDENIQPAAGTGMVVAAHMVPLACDAIQQPEQAMSLGNEIEMPMASGVSYEDVV